MNKTMRGLFVLIGLLVFAAVFCFWIPFIFLPNQGIGVALPVIFLPGEILVNDFLGEGFHLTNTLVGMVLADVVIVLLLVALYLGGGVRAVPKRLQSVLELFVGYMYNFAKSVAGPNAGRIFPLVMTIFFFLMISNWLELVPGVDSIGLIHCAEDGLSGYPLNEEASFLGINTVALRNTSPLNAGDPASEANFCACEAVNLGHFPAGEEAHCVVVLGEVGVNVPEDELASAEYELAEEVIARAEAGEDVPDAELEEAEHLIEDYEAEHPAGEESEGDEHHGAISEGLMTAILAADDQHEAFVIADAAATEAEQSGADNAEALRDAAATLAAGAVDADLFVVTPFVRAATTDLNLTIALAVFAVIAIQVYGVWALGPDYFQKFLNLRALGNLGKKPLGLIDFAVGIFEIVSEFAKIISFAFRLFGNIFAGQVLLFIMAFLVATMLPVVFYALELFVGLMQAFVFSVLTLIFSAQAMESHHHDENEHH